MPRRRAHAPNYKDLSSSEVEDDEDEVVVSGGSENEESTQSDRDFVASEDESEGESESEDEQSETTLRLTIKHPLSHLCVPTQGLNPRPACTACHNFFEAFVDEEAFIRHLHCHTILKLKWEQNRQCAPDVLIRSLHNELKESILTGALGTFTKPLNPIRIHYPRHAHVISLLSALPEKQLAESLLPALLQVIKDPSDPCIAMSSMQLNDTVGKSPIIFVGLKRQRQQFESSTVEVEEVKEDEGVEEVEEKYPETRRSQRVKFQAKTVHMDRQLRLILTSLRDIGPANAAQVSGRLGGGTGMDMFQSKMTELEKQGLVHRRGEEYDITHEGACKLDRAVVE